MFPLETAIQNWRRQMRAAGIKAPAQLDELESHLRDDLDAQMNSGLTVRESFELAVRRLGAALELQAEFQLSETHDPMKPKLTEILVLVLVLFVELGLILPAVARMRAHEAFDASGAIAGLTGALLFAATLAYATFITVKRLKNHPKA